MEIGKIASIMRKPRMRDTHTHLRNRADQFCWAVEVGGAKAFWAE
jgi:hypothetical protein